MWVNKWVNNLSEKQIIILKAINKNQEVKKSALQQLTDFSSTAIDNNLEVLKKEGLLEREGTKGGVWILHYIYPKVGEQKKNYPINITRKQAVSLRSFPLFRSAVPVGRAFLRSTDTSQHKK